MHFSVSTMPLSTSRATKECKADKATWLKWNSTSGWCVIKTSTLEYLRRLLLSYREQQLSCAGWNYLFAFYATQKPWVAASCKCIRAAPRRDLCLPRCSEFRVIDRGPFSQCNWHRKKKIRVGKILDWGSHTSVSGLKIDFRSMVEAECRKKLERKKIVFRGRALALRIKMGN